MEINKDFLASHIYFSDPFSDDPIKDQQQKKIFKEIISDLIANSLFCFADDYYEASPLAVEDDLLEIKYCIDMFPAVNASVDIYHNWIILNLYTLFAANNMTLITDVLDLLNSSEMKVTEIIRKASEWIQSDTNANLISRYIKNFGAKKKIIPVNIDNRIYATWGQDLFINSKYAGYSFAVLWLIILHELGHWQYARFKTEWKIAYQKQALDVLTKQYSKDFIESNVCRLDVWLEEIIADYIAILYFTKFNRQNSDIKQCTKECYIAIGLFYGLLLMEELGQDLYNKISNTHPPVSIRQNVVQSLYANFFSEILKIPFAHFNEYEINEWRIIQTYFSELIDKYWRNNNGKDF